MSSWPETPKEPISMESAAFTSSSVQPFNSAALNCCIN
eukprot:CAMPEP_0194760136 /NCGR_PEP_ID=MMETSP0323_2-20130528/13093_1 /TAXON_ID=2866 ORGANISM="Crypthecodinium cohnii, Strain Seligo" /NCGR_SAMPLE_ID=MMETSP0323_2 /ASSEMBLY_ACC=CAM_ASM_000346 /LENGTH=37 /DNA_ID= /DNA_START= /DNA_END= /DNA_ORIENTATION=